MDQIGAILGPLLVALAIRAAGARVPYRSAFRLLLIPALLALAVLGMARLLYPKSRILEPRATATNSDGLPAKFRTYILAVALLAAGYADFPLISFHLKKSGSVPDTWIPLLYGGAMGVDAVAALVFGRLYDKIKVKSLILAIGLSAFFAPFAFSSNWRAAMIGIGLWGIGMGAQESILRAAVAEIVPPGRRASAYGTLNAGYGFFWFVGSAVMGVLYDVSMPLLVAFSVATQLGSAAVLAALTRR